MKTILFTGFPGFIGMRLLPRILELTPETVGGWLKPSDVVELTIERLGTLRNRIVPHP